MSKAKKPDTALLKRRIYALHALTVASMKMYFRNKTGVFFTLFIPVILIFVFGFLFQSNDFKTDIAITNYSQTELSQKFVQSLKEVKAFTVKEVSEGEAADLLGRGQIDLQVIVPDTFGQPDPATRSLKPATIQTYYNEGNPQVGQTTNLILSQIVAGFNAQATQAPVVLSVESKGVKTNNLSQIDFFLPGVIAMSIMQLGIFAVAFAFVAYKTTGQLRRIQATPTRPMYFVVAQGTSRLIISVVQVLLLLALGMWIFDAHMIGSLLSFLFVAALGSAVFLGIGFAIAGWARDENQATPVAQLIQFPMLFLSGVFFPREGLPQWLESITRLLPLTFLVDALRKIATEGASLWALHSELLGLLVWGVIIYIIATLVFRWE
ncbi:ABC transporter permease [bacterium]|nr:MAG: ABC transporter permease [bacterium]